MGWPSSTTWRTGGAATAFRAARSSGPSSPPEPAEAALTTTDWDGRRYRRVNSLQQWLAARALDGVDLTGVHQLLDVGCGDGRITKSLVDRIPDSRGVGVDPSPRMIAVAPASDRLTFVVGAAETMSFRDEFDLVVSFNALHWVKDQTAALAAIATAARRGGRATLVFVCDGPLPSIEDVAMTVATSPRWGNRLDGFTAPYLHPDPQQWQRDVTSAGLLVDDVRVDDLEWDFGSREAFAAWCAVGFGGWTGNLPPDHVDRFVADIVDAYAAARGSDHVFRFRQLVGNLSKPWVR